MLGRRNLRIKVMQVLYGWEMDHSVPYKTLESELKRQIQRTVNLYVTQVQYLIEVCNYSMVDKAKRLAKFIKTEEDINASTAIASNQIVKYLSQHQRINELAKAEGIRNYVQQDIVKNLFNELQVKQKYKEYNALTEHGLQSDRDVLIYIVKKIMLESENLAQHLEEHFVNYQDDNNLLLHVLTKYIEGFDGNKDVFTQGLELWEEEKQFALDLLAKTIDHNDELTENIKPNLKNWDMDRVAILDLIILKMAVCELKHFPTVPVKVSINEYIDISKMYSTPKSKDFVNGVLDKVRIQLQDADAIKKYGRGLME